MNWFYFLMRTLSVVPAVVAGVEAIHQGVPGATKKEIAMQSLGLAAGAALTVAPEHKEAIAAAAILVSNTIDGVVGVLNAAKVTVPSVLPAASAPAPAEAPVFGVTVPPAVVSAIVQIRRLGD